MAIGDVVVFDQFLVDALKKVHNLDTDTIKVGLITSAQTPAVTSNDPRWGAGGLTNFSTAEVTPGGLYAAGGYDITAGAAVTLDTGAAKFDSSTDVSYLQNGSNPTNARWAIIYNDTSTGKECIGYVDLGSDINLSTGDFSINWNASGIFTVNQA